MLRQNSSIDDHVDHDVYGNYDDRLHHGDFGDYDQHGEPDDHGHDNHDDHIDHLHHHDHDDHLEDDDQLDHDELITIKFVRKLKVVHKEVGGCTQGSWQRRIAALIALNDESLVSHSVSHKLSYLCRYEAARAANNEKLRIRLRSIQGLDGLDD